VERMILGLREAHDAGFYSSVIPKRWIACHSLMASAQFRTIQICPKDLSPRMAAQSSVRAAGISMPLSRGKEAEIKLPATPA